MEQDRRFDNLSDIDDIDNIDLDDYYADDEPDFEIKESSTNMDDIDNMDLEDYYVDDEESDFEVKEEPSDSIDDIEFDGLDGGFDDSDIDDIIMNESDKLEDLDDLDKRIAELESDIGDTSNSDSYDLDDLDKRIAELESELGDTSSNEELSGADNYGTVIDDSELMEEVENYQVAQKENDFISSDGEIVVMNPSDSEDNFKLVYVDIENIAIVKRIRNLNGVEDLVKSIKSTGLLKPIDVAPTSVEGIYVLLDGYRRIIACARAGKRRIPCVVNTRVSVPEIPILEAMYNHQKPYSIKEMIDYIDYLEKEKGIMSASMIEYLLQMNSGDYTKLKDILNDGDEEIVSKLMEGAYTIDAAFKKLEQRRKKESAEERELKKAIRAYDEDPNSTMDDVSGQGETGDPNEALSDTELSNLAVNATNLDDADDETFEDLIEAGNVDGFKPHKQDPKYRERLDPKLRKQVLARDDNHCRICGIGGMEFVEVLDVHHIQEVYLGGDDSLDNLVTACTVCHKLVHMYGRGDLNIRPMSEFSEAEQRRFKKIIKLGNKIRTDMKCRGMKLDELKKLDNTDTIGRTKPGTGQTAG